MATIQAVKAIGIENHCVALGCLADWVILNEECVPQVIGTVLANRTTIKVGKIISQTRRKIYENALF